MLLGRPARASVSAGRSASAPLWPLPREDDMTTHAFRGYAKQGTQRGNRNRARPPPGCWAFG
eukprot:2690789-Prymnesium_polylepis.1